MTYRLDARGLGVRIGSAQIVHDLNLSLCSGELIALLGPSGSGKSTLLRALIGFRPGDGEVSLCGQDLYEELESLKTLIGYVPQDDVVHRSLTVERTLMYAAQLRLHKDMPDALRNATVRSAIEAVELSDRADVKVKNLSGGQRKRVSIAVELLAKPPLLFLDEPTSGLDPALEERTMQLFRSLTGPDRITLVTTHVLASLDIVDLVLIMAQGRLVFVGPPAAAPEFFGVNDLPSIYRILSRTQPEAWAQKFLDSPHHRDLVARRLASPPPPLPAVTRASGSSAEAPLQVIESGRRVEAEPSQRRPQEDQATSGPTPEEILARLKADRDDK